ncbi:MAG TPA: hypothetical protein VGD09_15285 [Blastococcus sp.]
MAISVLDVRDTFATPHVTVPARAAVAAAVEAAPRRLPVTVVSAGLIGVLEAVGLLAVALTGLDGVLSSPSRPAGWIVAGGLLLLAAWIVLCAGSGAALIDGAGRKLLLGVTYAEMALVAMLMVIATATPVPTPGDIPAPALGLMALAVPVGKLLLAGAPSAQRWVAEGPRTRVRRVDPVQTHRLLATVTLAVIGLSLAAVAVLAPVQSGGPNDPASVVGSH